MPLTFCCWAMRVKSMVSVVGAFDDTHLCALWWCARTHSPSVIPGTCPHTNSQKWPDVRRVCLFLTLTQHSSGPGYVRWTADDCQEWKMRFDSHVCVCVISTAGSWQSAIVHPFRWLSSKTSHRFCCFVEWMRHWCMFCTSVAFLPVSSSQTRCKNK